MFGMESFRRPKATPEEIKSALHAADIVAREKADERRKADAQSEESARLSRLIFQEQARTAKPHEIGNKEIEEAEEATGHKFERLN